jgi:hypothetical protein
MANFCRACTRDIWDLDSNDIDGPRWALCEGCGVHHFDIDGHRMCGLPTPPSDDIDGAPCALCLERMEGRHGG